MYLKNPLNARENQICNKPELPQAPKNCQKFVNKWNNKIYNFKLKFKDELVLGIWLFNN